MSLLLKKAFSVGNCSARQIKITNNELQTKHETLIRKLGKLSEDGPEAMAQFKSEIAKTSDEVNSGPVKRSFFSFVFDILDVPI